MWCAAFAEGHGFSHTAFISKNLKLGGKIFEPILEVTEVQGFDHDQFFSRASSRISACSPYINIKSLELVNEIFCFRRCVKGGGRCQT